MLAIVFKKEEQVAERRCLNEGSCPGNLEECNLQFPIEVRGGLKPSDRIFICNVCMKVFFIGKDPRCTICGMDLLNEIHFSRRVQILTDEEKLWPKHKFRVEAKS